MPFQPQNYSQFQVRKQDPQELMNILTNAYKMYQMPGELKRGREADELAKRLKELQINRLENPEPSEFQQKMNAFTKWMQGGNAQVNPQENTQNESPVQNPQNEEIVNAFMRSMFGIPNELPSEKNINEIEKEKRNLANQITLEGVKSGNKKQEEAAKTKDDITTATKTLNEKRVHAVRSLMPQLANLINYENPSNISYSPFSSTQTNTKRYNDLTTLPLENIMSGFNWQGLAANVEKAENLVKIGAGENKQDYRRRIVQLSHDILREVEGMPGSEEILQNMPKVKMQYKGKLLEVPLTDVETILKKYKGSKFYEK